MSHYMTQFTYTAETWAALQKNPTDRTAAVNALADKLGCRVIGLYYQLGEYDGVLMFEAPDDSRATAFLMASRAPGHLKATRTTRLLTPSEAVAAMRKAQGVEFDSPRR
jgi:uncharacterized protein with GYD domain